MNKTAAALFLLMCCVPGRDGGAVDAGPVKPVTMVVSPLSTLYEQRTAIDLRIIEMSVRLSQAKQARDRELSYLHKWRPKSAMTRNMTVDQIAEEIRQMSDSETALPPFGWERHLYGETATRKAWEHIHSIAADEAALEQLRKLRDDLQKEIESQQTAARSGGGQ